MPAVKSEGKRKDVLFCSSGLDVLLPMHIRVGPTGHILHAGPTFKKLCRGQKVIGARFAELLEVRRPYGVQLVKDLLDRTDRTVHVAFRTPPRRSLKGVVVRLPENQGALLNFSLGISVAELVSQYGLKSKDFAPSDCTVEMLYLIEAQSAILEESKKLNTRLQVGKIAAEEQAFTDTLTGLKNRRALDHVLARVTERREKTGFGLMHIDLDYFKSVNDTYGHAAGDFVLQRAAEIFVEETRADDIVARSGGDEFVIVLTNCPDRKKLNAIARRIIKRLEQPIDYKGVACRVSASIGITISDIYQQPAPNRMCDDADKALYQSKRKGRARHTIFQPDDGAHLA